MTTTEVQKPLVQTTQVNGDVDLDSIQFRAIRGAFACMGRAGKFACILEAASQYPFIEDHVRFGTHNSIPENALPDETLKVEGSDGKLYTIPKLVRSIHPVPGEIRVFGRAGDSNAYNMHHRPELRTATPRPKPGIMDKIKTAQSRFDAIEVWWVPMLVTATPVQKDPIVVGVINLALETLQPGNLSDPKTSLYFEIDRWVDDTIEEGWFALTAY